MTAPSAAPQEKLPLVIYVMAAAAGTIGANVHYSQPLIPEIARDLGIAPAIVGYLPAITQVGFAIGLLVVLPLADRLDKRRLVVATVVLAALALFAQAVATDAFWLLTAGLFVGAVSVSPQVLVPFGYSTAPAGRGGQASGLVLSGVLLGVLLSKVVAGIITEFAGWSTLYFAAGGAMAVVAVILWLVLPRDTPGTPSTKAAQPESRFLSTLLAPFTLLRNLPDLRRHALLGALGGAMFMVFWSTYALHLEERFGLGPLAAGLFAIVGIAGSVLAPLAGKLVDRGRTPLVFGLASAAVLVAFALMLVGSSEVPAIAAAALLLDAGVGAAHAGNQARIFRLGATQLGRLNSAYMFMYFVGAAIGAGVATSVYGLFGWFGVCALGLVIGVAFATIVACSRRALARP